MESQNLKKMIKLIKNITIITLNLLAVFFTIGFFWALFWLMCILSDHCYYSNFGAF